MEVCEKDVYMTINYIFMYVIKHTLFQTHK